MTTLDARYAAPRTVPGPVPAGPPVQPAGDAVLAEPEGPPARALAASRRGELADFLRSRRERISPDQVGLPSGGRRRTPGLRREEVAMLSGLGVTWYTWLEQGRDIRVSPQVLEAVARTLQLDRHERSHLYTLADIQLGSAAPDCNTLGANVRAILDQLGPFPSCVMNARYDVLAHNVSYTKIGGDLDSLPVEDRNTLWLAFTSHGRRALLVDWDESVSRMVGMLRAAMADHVGEPAWKRLVARLEACSPEFVELWHRHDVYAAENLVKRLLHPELGLLTFQYTSLWLNQATGVRLLTYVPADDATRAAVLRFPEVAAPAL